MRTPVGPARSASSGEEITRAAGIAKGSFYLHFESKEHLLTALQQDFEADLVARLDAAVAAAGPDPHAQVLAWIDAAFTHYPDDVARHDMLFHHTALALADADGRSLAQRPPGFRTLVDSLTDVVRAGVDHGVFDVADVEVTAMLLADALHLTFDRAWHITDRVDRDRIRRAVQVMVERTLAVGATTS